MATIPYNFKNPHNRHNRSLGEDNAANWAIGDSLKPNFRHIGGVYRLAKQTYADGDDVVANFDANGRLKCILDGATFTVSGDDLEIDVSAFRGTAGVTDRQDAWIYVADEDLSTVSELWQGFGGWDETADRFRALPLPTDHAAMPADPQIVPSGGEYRLAVDTYDDGDAVVTHYDIKGHLITTNDAIYAEDAGHTTADEGMFILGVRQDTLASSVDTDADYGALKFNAKGSQYMDLSSVLGSDMSVTNGGFMNITDNTTGVGVIAGTTALKTDTSSVAGTATNVNGGNRDAGTQTVTLADDDPATVSLALIDDTVSVFGTATYAEATTKGLNIGAVRNDVLAALADTDNEIAPLQVNAKGGMYVDVSSTLGSDISVTNGIYTLITDNTTAATVETAGTKKALNVNVTDGTNDMPTGDAVARSIYTAIGDGTTTVYVNPSTAGTEDEAQPGLRTDSVLMGYDPSAVANSQLKAVHVVTDNAATNGIPNTLISGGVYKAALDTYADNDAVPLHFDNKGRLLTSDAGGTQVLVVTSTGAAAIDVDTSIAAEWKLNKITVHLSAAPTTSEDFVVKLDSNAGAAYDTELYSIDPSVESLTDFVFIPKNDMKFVSGDEIDIDYTNTDTRTYGVTIYYELA